MFASVTLYFTGGVIVVASSVADIFLPFSLCY